MGDLQLDGGQSVGGEPSSNPGDVGMDLTVLDFPPALSDNLLWLPPVLHPSTLFQVVRPYDLTFFQELDGSLGATNRATNHLPVNWEWYSLWKVQLNGHTMCEASSFNGVSPRHNTLAVDYPCNEQSAPISGSQPKSTRPAPIPEDILLYSPDSASPPPPPSPIDPDPSTPQEISLCKPLIATAGSIVPCPKHINDRWPPLPAFAPMPQAVAHVTATCTPSD